MFCSAAETFAPVEAGLCDPYLRPPENETCNASPCKPRWNVGEWGNCTEGNGTQDCTQFQFRNVFCEQTLANNVPSLVGEEECGGLGEPPLAVKACDEEIEDDFQVEDGSGPRYHEGPWTGCSVLCGAGIRTRQVTCYRINAETGAVEVLDEADCPATRPPTEQPCSNETPCEPADWIVSDRTSCEGVCGLTHSSRHAVCTDASGVALLETEVAGRCRGEAPPLEEECELPAAPCEFGWFASQWSACSSKCQGVAGLQSRTVFCGSLAEDGTVTNTTEENCAEEEVYNTTQPCMGTDSCTGTWYASSYSACSEDCGPGKMARKVFCLGGEGEPVSPDQCPEDVQPLEEADCDNQCEEASSGNGTAEAEAECEYYDDWWIFGQEGSGQEGSGQEGNEEEVSQRRKRQAEEGSGSGGEAGSGSGEENEEEAGSGETPAAEEGGSPGNQTEAGSKNKTEIDLSLFSRRCKPEPVEPCENSTYGCCPDGFFSASGPFQEGCAEYRSCEDTRYGCCR